VSFLLLNFGLYLLNAIFIFFFNLLSLERECVSRLGFEFLLDYYYGFIGFVLINDGAEKPITMEIGGSQQLSGGPLPFARRLFLNFLSYFLVDEKIEEKKRAENILFLHQTSIFLYFPITPILGHCYLLKLIFFLMSSKSGCCCSLTFGWFLIFLFIAW
jgi:hypothetical protein